MIITLIFFNFNLIIRIMTNNSLNFNIIFFMLWESMIICTSNNPQKSDPCLNKDLFFTRGDFLDFFVVASFVGLLLLQLLSYEICWLHEIILKFTYYEHVCVCLWFHIYFASLCSVIICSENWRITQNEGSNGVAVILSDIILAQDVDVDIIRNISWLIIFSKMQLLLRHTWCSESSRKRCHEFKALVQKSSSHP